VVAVRTAAVAVEEDSTAAVARFPTVEVVVAAPTVAAITDSIIH